MSLVYLGNAQVLEHFRDSDGVVKRRDRIDLQAQVTTVHFPDDWSLGERLESLRKLWPWHSDTDGPEWVESDDELLATAIASQYTTKDHECRQGRPEGWNEGRG
jgi:hypothetical protein